MIERIKNIRQHGKTARGQKELLKHLSGQKLTFKQAIYARCYDCMGYYADGKQDCKMPHCALFPFNPYNQNREKRTVKKTMPGDQVEKMRAARL
jgi:hypothetical protein